MTKRSAHIPIGRAVAVVVAGGVFGVAGTIALTAAELPSQRQRAAESSVINEWARTQHLTGLSPASLSAPDRDSDVDTGRAAELAAIAEFVADEGLSGLSPASLHATGE